MQGRKQSAGRSAAAVTTAEEKFTFRGADKTRDKNIGRIVIKFGRRADLLDQPRPQHHDAVGQRHRLDLVMRDIDHGNAERAVELGDLDAHLCAQFGIEIGKRLVEQKQLRMAHDGPADRDALALAAGKLARLALKQQARFAGSARPRQRAA